MMKREKGFTLIELMIVVAIIGILAAIAIPRFAALIDKAREAGARGNLGALRSAIAIYYGDTKGYWPRSLDGVSHAVIGTGNETEPLPAFVPKYLARIPYATLKRNADNNRSNNVTMVLTTEDQEIAASQIPGNIGGWIYSSNSGDIRINSTFQDTTVLVTTNTSMRYSNYGHEEP
jgi:type II secretion system protein G